MANKKKAVSRAAIGELIRKHKGKNAPSPRTSAAARTRNTTATSLSA